MSLCEEDKLGRDPTVYQNSKTGKWEIMVFDDGSEDRYKLFTVIDCMRTADRTFGRHTRCYRCIETDLSGDIEGDSGNSAEQHNKREIFIKDAWAIVFQESDQKLRDEVSLLREINSKLKGNAELADKYPALVAGGVVKQVGKDGKYFEDSIDNVFSELGEDTVKQLTFRIHKRMAMSPIGEDIRSVKSVNELIIAAADIMEVHSAIRKKCNILHRDISVNNMLINRRTSEGKEAVHGMVIDFDCALRIDESTEREVRPEMTGTFPFMSINNLDVCSKARRTELDDWESMIYVLCWLGTFGVNKGDMEKQKSVIDGLDSPDILKWRDNNSWEVAKTKRNDMNSESNFASRITKRFVRGRSYLQLRKLVSGLRRALFDNPMLSSLARGSFSKDKYDLEYELASISEKSDSHDSDAKKEYWDDCCGPEVVDQFERRAACADKIADALLKVIVNARNHALESAASEQSPQ
ncbi:hypothetical protein GGH99_003865 [Coemansia sp. RSA 1285]|nr:hypothetical protein GGH99_003865 [Coemansia sp. RSA 1285]